MTRVAAEGTMVDLADLLTAAAETAVMTKAAARAMKTETRAAAGTTAALAGHLTEAEDPVATTKAVARAMRMVSMRAAADMTHPWAARSVPAFR
jgi:hypothetical protein